LYTLYTCATVIYLQRNYAAASRTRALASLQVTARKVDDIFTIRLAKLYNTLCA